MPLDSQNEFILNALIEQRKDEAELKSPSFLVSQDASSSQRQSEKANQNSTSQPDSGKKPERKQPLKFGLLNEKSALNVNRMEIRCQ